MEIAAKIPVEKREGCSLYVSSAIQGIAPIPGVGHILYFRGCAVVFYSYSIYRRAYVVAPIDDKCAHLPLMWGRLPFLSRPMYILGIAEGRKIDLLKFMCFNLEKLKGKSIWLWDPAFWLRVCAVLDRPANKRKGRTMRLAKSLVKLWERKYKGEEIEYEINE